MRETKTKQQKRKSVRVCCKYEWFAFTEQVTDHVVRCPRCQLVKEGKNHMRAIREQ